MHAREFRRDLYYRLSVVTLTLPPLRERHEDVPLLVETYLARFRAQLGRHDLEVTERAMAALAGYSWPGNVRELINVIERAVLLCEGEDVLPDDLPEAIAAAAQPAPPAGVTRQFDESVKQLDDAWLRRPLAESRLAWNTAHERAYLDGLLRLTNGRISETAERAGIDPRSLYTKMKHHGLRKED
ncbi:MAG: sigma-54-dependent Fis family transcriptional regulator, partial [Candidatus Eisenbacteria bacterium]|nr:sigma-54-dependent Fis family transcriptional regulator [Candidatus Eisenbacteria bacterium]